MDLKEKRKHYVKVDEDIENNKIYTFLYEVERNGAYWQIIEQLER